MRGGVLLAVLLVSLNAGAQQGGGTSTPPSVVNGQPAKKPNGNGRAVVKSRRKILTKEECFIGEECELPDGTIFQVNYGRTPRVDELWSDYKRRQAEGTATTEELEGMRKAIEELEKALLEGNQARFAELEAKYKTQWLEVQNLKSEYRPFRIGAVVPVGVVNGLMMGLQWQPPRFTKKLHMVFGLDGGVGRMSAVPSPVKSRAVWSANASLNYFVGPGKAFLGALITGDSNLFDSGQPFMGRNWVGVGPMTGYRWGMTRDLSLDVTAQFPYGKLAWLPVPAWMPSGNVALMWQFGGSDKSAEVATDDVHDDDVYEGEVARR